MLCILRLSLTSKWFGFTFLWSPAGRCLRGALPIVGTRPPLPLYPSTSLPPILPGCHSTPICPSPPLLTLSHTQHTHTSGGGWLAWFLGLPASAARPRLREPPARRAAGHRGRTEPSEIGAGTWNHSLCPLRQGPPAPATPTEPRSLTGPPGHLPQGIPGTTS